MDCPSHKFLAGTGLTLDDNRERRVRHLADLLHNLLHLSTRAYQPPQRALDSPLYFLKFASALFESLLQFVRVALECQLLLLDAVPQLDFLDRPAQRDNEIIPVDWFLNEVAGSPAERINRQRMVPVPGDHQGG